jgi:hypothetical protein
VPYDGINFEYLANIYEGDVPNEINRVCTPYGTNGAEPQYWACRQEATKDYWIGLAKKRPGAKTMAATPPPTNTDLNNAIQGLGAELLGLKDGLQNISNKVTNVSEDITKDSTKPGLSVDNKLLIGAAVLAGLFFFRKKLFH